MVVSNIRLSPASNAVPSLPPSPPHPSDLKLVSCMMPFTQRPTIITTPPPPLMDPGFYHQYSQGFSNHSSPVASPPPISHNVGITNGTTVFTYAYPPNYVPTTSYQIVSYPTDPTQCKLLTTNPAVTTVSSILPCSPAVYTCNPNVVPCQQRMVNGTTVLQCIPGVCPMMAPAPVYRNGTVGVCRVPPPAVISRIPVSPPSLASMASRVHVACTTAATTWKQSYGMEQVWQAYFRIIFQQFSPHAWTLLPVSSVPKGLWHTYVDSAKVRFCCEGCGHGWTSMKGRVAFWFILNPATNEGVVCLKLYGQQCNRCKTGNYEPAMWYPEEVLKVIVNIYNEVGGIYYGFPQVPYHKLRRAGKPRTPHNAQLCQACKDGVCSDKR